MIRLIATDIDGTLTRPGREIPEENRAALREAHGRGVVVALATVRVRWTADEVVKDLGIPCPLVSQGGAAVLDADRKVVREVTIPLDLAREIAACADRNGFGLLTTVDSEHYFGPGYVPILDGVPDRHDHPESNLATVTAPPTRFMVTGAHGVEVLQEAFADAPLKIARHYRADGTLLDAAITAREATKEPHWPGREAPAETPLFSPVVTFGEMVFVSGIGAHFEGDVKAHTAHVLDQMKKNLEAVGSSMEKVLKVNVYLNDLKDYQAMNEVFRGRFGETPGVRTTIAAAGGIPGDSLVEIDCIAYI